MKSQSILVLAIVVLFVIAAWACELAFVAYIVGWGGNWYSQADVPAGNDFLAVAGAGGQPDSDALVLSRQPWALGGPDRVVIVGQPVSFYGQAGSEDEEIVEYAWDFESDGVPDFVSDRTGVTTHRFNVAGDYRCVFTVKDSAGQVAQDAVRIIVVGEKLADETAEQMLRPIRQLGNNPADGTTYQYAVVINGGYESRYWTDVELAYDMLTNGYGFSPSDIYLLSYNGTNPDGNNPDGMIDYSATQTNLQTVFNELASRTDGDDEVFICITDHGRGYSGPLSEGGQYLGYCDGRISVDPGDEPDFAEGDFKLRSIFTGGDYRCNHGMGVWKVRRKYYSGIGYHFYRNKYVSTLDNVYIEDLGTTVSDSDIYIERLVDYALGDTDGDGYIDTGAGEVFDFDGDGNEPYDHSTGEFDEDDWGQIDILEDNHNSTGTVMPANSSPYQLFDNAFEGKICVDLAYAGGEPQVDGRDEDNAGLFDWMDVNMDGDTLDIVSVDEAIKLYGGNLYDDDLADLVDQLSVAKITIVALPCFSGGLVEDISEPNRILCTATIEDAVSWGDLFIRGFIAALHGQNEYGSPVDADTNEDGYVSMLEAFNYAAGNDYYDEIPQYDDNGDGVSHTDPVPAGGDGSLGSETYLSGFIAGNCDGDSDVDMADFAIFALAWRSSPGDDNWNPICDISYPRDDIINKLDLGVLSENWLKGMALPQLPKLYEFSLDTDPGWSTEGEWAFGQPTGGGGAHGGPDPTSGHTGSNVYGYNLNGDYTNSLPERHLTSTAIDCRGLFNVGLRFWRWLGVEQPVFDHAYVQVSNNGTDWVIVWENNAEVADTTWQEINIDISAIADDQPTVYLRWTMGDTDGSWTYCGWNIDDIQVGQIP